RPTSKVFTFPTAPFEDALGASNTDWFHKKLRCDCKSFQRICREVHAAYECKPAANRGNYGLGCLNNGNFSVVYIYECMEVLSHMTAKYVVLPDSSEVKEVEEGFQLVAGLPDVVRAVDGTLVAIPRPHDSRDDIAEKVGHLGRFRSISIRAGSNNDQSLWNGSGGRKRLSEFVSRGKHLLGDACYKIWAHIVTPSSESEVIDSYRTRVYNRLHSPKLEQKTPERICKLVYSCVALHNMLMSAKDSVDAQGIDPLRSQPLFNDDDGGLPVSEQPFSHTLKNIQTKRHSRYIHLIV
ncbi:hypothetical protein GN958_ATG17379, partial [Phytophthora infestans]